MYLFILVGGLCFFSLPCVFYRCYKHWNNNDLKVWPLLCGCSVAGFESLTVPMAYPCDFFLLPSLPSLPPPWLAEAGEEDGEPREAQPGARKGPRRLP